MTILAVALANTLMARSRIFITLHPSLLVVEVFVSVNASSFVSLSFHSNHSVRLPETSIRAKEYS
jgi:hypothetical protein